MTIEPSTKDIGLIMPDTWNGKPFKNINVAKRQFPTSGNQIDYVINSIKILSH